MKEYKIYTLPTSCTCRYVAKKNWIEMEVHYDKCGQYRILVRKSFAEQKRINDKSKPKEE